MLIIWPSLWIFAMLVLIMATAVAGMREKKARAKAAPQGMQPIPMSDEAIAPMDGNADGFGDSFGNNDAFGEDPFK